jgi:hypothetical protein
VNGDTQRHRSVRRQRAAFELTLLTVANAAVFFAAAVLHLGVRIPLGFATLAVPEPIPPATVVETLIGAGLAAAAVALFVHARRAWRLTRAAYIFALGGTLFGLTVALLRGLRGLDIWIHFVMLAGLAAGLVLLARANTSRGSRGVVDSSRP